MGGGTKKKTAVKKTRDRDSLSAAAQRRNGPGPALSLYTRGGAGGERGEDAA